MQAKVQKKGYSIPINLIKEHLSAVIEKYIREFPNEWEAFKIQNKNIRDNLMNDWADFEKQAKAKMIERWLCEVPQTLVYLLNISDVIVKEEIDWFFSLDGQNWLGKAYPDFLISKKI